MVRVVYVDHTAKLSGGEIALDRLLSALAGQVEPLVVLGEDGPLADSLRARDIQVVVEPLAADVGEVRKDSLTGPRAVLGQAVGTLRYVWRLRRIIRRSGADVVHTNSLKSGLYGTLAARLAGVPAVWHVRDRLADDYLPGPAVRLVRAALAVLPTAVICNSESTRSTVRPDRLSLRLRAARGRFSLVALPDPLAGPVAPAPRPPRAGGALRVGMVGRLAPWKGQDVAIRAFARADLPAGSRLVLIGSAMFGEEDYERNLVAEVARLGLGERVTFAGFVSDVPAALAEIDVVVHASLTPEPFGQVIVEAMAEGLPVLAADAGGPAEIVTSGVDGLLYPPGDDAALAGLLESVARDPGLADALAAAAVGRARDFEPARIAPRFAAVYAGLATRGRRGPAR